MTAGIPMCDVRPVAVLVFDRDGHGEQRYPYCHEHFVLLRNTLDVRHVPYRTERPQPTDSCYAWMSADRL